MPVSSRRTSRLQPVGCLGILCRPQGGCPQLAESPLLQAHVKWTSALLGLWGQLPLCEGDFFLSGLWTRLGLSTRAVKLWAGVSPLLFCWDKTTEAGCSSDCLCRGLGH